LYLTTKHDFENFGEGNCPDAHPVFAGLVIGEYGLVWERFVISSCFAISLIDYYFDYIFNVVCSLVRWKTHPRPSEQNSARNSTTFLTGTKLILGFQWQVQV